MMHHSEGNDILHPGASRKGGDSAASPAHGKRHPSTRGPRPARSHCPQEGWVPAHLSARHRVGPVRKWTIDKSFSKVPLLGAGYAWAVPLLLHSALRLNSTSHTTVHLPRILGAFPTGALGLERPGDNSKKPHICGSLGAPTRCLGTAICWTMEE